jgi:heterodisulfide reductase subunit C
LNVALEQQADSHTGVLDSPSFLEIVEAKTPGDSHLEMCIQCGTCGGSCPSGADMDYTPRQVFAMIRAGMEDEVLSCNTPWYCVSCYLCTVRCPQEVKITDLMYTLKSMAINKGRTKVNSAKDFSETFIGYVETYGRSFELGLATRQSIFHMPMGMVGTTAMGVGLLTKGRMDMAPHKIEGIQQLRTILARAKELEL